MFALFIILLIGTIAVFSSLSSKLGKLQRQTLNLNERLKKLESDVPITAPSDPVKTAALQTSAPKAAPVKTPDAVPAMAAAAPAPAINAPRADVPDVPDTREPQKSKPKKPTQSLEDRIGGQWSVWVGGLALLLGAILLIRYSIEAGFFGPGARLLMAYALGGLLLAAGEWLRRADAKLPARLAEATKSIEAHVPIPALLSAIGVFTWLGATYAAQALYGFIPPIVAFAGLGFISIGAMVLSLRQGPLLAIIGLLASFATPLLIETEAPSLFGLYGYLIIIGAAALVLAERTNWRWLGLGVTFGWLGWSVLSASHQLDMSHQMIWLGFLGLGFGVTVWLASRAPASANLDPLKDWQAVRHHPISAVIWSAVAAVAAAPYLTQFEGVQIVAESEMDVPNLLDYLQIALVVAALCLAGLRYRLQAAHIAVAAVLALVVLTETGTEMPRFILAGLSGVTIGLMLYQSLLTSNVESKKGVPQSLYWAVGAIGLALAGAALSAFSYPSPLSNDQHAIWLAVYVLVFAAMTAVFHRRAKPSLTLTYAIGTAVAYALAAMFAFDEIALSLTWSLGIALAGAAAIFARVQGARLAALGLAGLAMAYALLIPFMDMGELSTRPILNALWIYIALPTALLAALGFGLRRRDWNDVITDMVEAAALAGLALFAVFQIRHLSNAGEIYADTFGFGELGLQVATGLCFTLAGLSRRFGDNKLLATLAQGVSLISLGLFGAFGLLLLSPLLNETQDVTGNLAFNSLTLGFAVPAILLGLCAWLARGRRSQLYVNALGGLSLAGVLSWLTGMIRFGFNGETISIFDQDFGNVELYIISAVWLLFGIILLAAGVRWRQMALRLASAIVIVLTVLKTFLIDMAGLEGVLRPLSFVGLGLALIVIGRAYQKYWLSNRPNGPADQPAEIGGVGEE